MHQPTTSPTHAAVRAVAALRITEYRTAAAVLLRRMATAPHGGCDSHTGRMWKRARRMLRHARALEQAVGQ